MKILILNYEYPPLGGGAGVITQHISESLTKLENEVTILTTWFKGEKQDETKNNLRVIKLKSKRKYIYKSNPVEMLSWIIKSKSFLKKYDKTKEFDLCFANFALPGGDVAYYLKKKYNIPYVIISHGHDVPWFYPKQMFFYHLITYFRIKKICLNSEINFVQTDKMKDNIDDFLGKSFYNKNIIIPNGWDSEQYKSDYSKKSKKFKIIFVGRLVEQKDPFTFLKAIKLYFIRNNDFIVHILGDGKLRKKMKKFVTKNNLSKNVKFLGWVSKEKMIEEYQSASLQVAPSLDEGMSITMLEALSCGQYVISTPLSGNIDIIKPNVNGDFIKTGDYKFLFEKIDDFYKNKFLKDYKTDKNVIEKQKKIFEWDNIVREYDKLLKDLLKKNKIFN